MRYALVDDATLEAAKRIEGISETKNRFEAAGDVLSMDNLLQAILFCDQIVYLAPAGAGTEPNCKLFESFQQIRLDAESYGKLLLRANQMTDRYIPCIEGGTFTDDFFCAFFHGLDLEIRFVWEKKAGVYELSPRMIRKDFDHRDAWNQKAMAMIQTELSDDSFVAEINPRIPLLYDAEGQIINNCYRLKDQNGKRYPAKLSMQSDALFKALNYMALRANLHLLAARELNVDLFLSPLRSLLQWGGYNLFFLKNKEVPPIPHENGCRIVPSHSGPLPAVQVHGIPRFTCWIAKNMQDYPGFIRAALELREEKEFIALRHCLTELSSRTGESFRHEADAAASLMVRLNSCFGKVTEKYTSGMQEDTYSTLITLMGGSPQANAHMPGMGGFHFELNPTDPAFEIAEKSTRNCVALNRPTGLDLGRLDMEDKTFDAVTSGIIFKEDEILQNMRSCQRLD